MSDFQPLPTSDDDKHVPEQLDPSRNEDAVQVENALSAHLPGKIEDDNGSSASSVNRDDYKEELSATHVLNAKETSVETLPFKLFTDIELNLEEHVWGIPSKKEWFIMIGICFQMYLCGWNDATTGPLLLRIQSHYSVSYTVVSLSYITNMLGALLGSMLSVYFNDWIGIGKVMVFGCICQIIAFSIESIAPPFPIFLMGYFLFGLGNSITFALANGLMCNMRGITTKMSLSHASYGMGAVSAPLVATQFAKMEKNWHFVFLCSLALALINAVLAIVLYRFKRIEVLMNTAPPDYTTKDNPSATTDAPSSSSKLLQVMRNPMAQLLTIYSIMYCGVEVTVGSWTPAYLEVNRGVGPNAGYASSAFYGGFVLGRLSLIVLSKLMDKYKLVVVFLVLCAALEVCVWQIPSTVGAFVAVACVGFCLGPMFPALVCVASDLMPPWMVFGTIAWLAGGGHAGAAMFPFITGAIATRFGSPWVVQPFLLVTMGLSFILWIMVLWFGRKKLVRPVFPMLSRDTKPVDNITTTQIE